MVLKSYKKVKSKKKKVQDDQEKENDQELESWHNNKKLKKKVDDDPYAGIYDDMPANLWKERSGEEDDWEEPLF